MDRELILAELVSRCENEIEMWGFRSNWCLEKIDKNRCPAEFADNELCREVLAAHTYQTSSTPEHPDGLIISNWFLRRIEDRDTGGEVICAKTGFVAQSRSCAASYGKDEAGNEYVCVTAGSSSSWQCIRDQVELYKEFAKTVE